MWLFTTHGFFSVVCLNNRPMDGSPLKGKLSVDKSRVAIRARVRKHLENLIEAFGVLRLCEILETPGRDYACRIVVPKDTWAAVARDLAEGVDYHNFKDAAGHDDQQYASWLSAVWSRGHAVQRGTRNPPVEEIKDQRAALAAMNTRDFIRFVRRSVTDLGWSGQPLFVWQALKQRGWAELRGKGASTSFDLTEEGQRRLGVML